MTTIMGLDVSLVRTGVAVLSDGALIGTDVIQTDFKAARHARLGQLLRRVIVMVRQYCPHIVVMETSGAWQKLSRDSRVSVEALAEARGVVLAAIDWAMEHTCLNISVVERDCHEVRESICANRNASKQQVAENLRLRGYVLPVMRNGKVDYDVCDALACALAVWCEQRLLAMKEGEK